MPLEAEILEIKAGNPEWGRTRIHRELTERGFFISEATVQRRLSALKKQNAADKPREKIIEDLTKEFSASELRAILGSSKGQAIRSSCVDWGDDSFKVLIMSDTHIGHKKFFPRLWDGMARAAEREGVDWAYHAGDILEGMSGRPGHVYELSEVGFEQQFKRACSLMRSFPVEIRGITGNHDLWYQGKADIGLNVGERLQDKLPNYTHLGDEEADEQVGNVKIKLWHGRDGSSYATSYRTQKFVESLRGGEKPHILFAGHAHKAIYHVCRNVQVFESGTTCGQTGHMRHKKLEAHTGFWIAEIWQNSTGLERIAPVWYPYFED